MHSVFVVIQYIVEYCTCIKLKMAKRKLQTELRLQQKSEVLLRIQKGESQRKLAEQYGVSETTIVNIKKNEHSIINSVESNFSQIRKRKMRKTENEEANNIMLEFFIKCRAQNIPVTGPMLQAKAAETASSLQLWDHRRICGPSLTETSLCGAYLYSDGAALGFFPLCYTAKCCTWT